ncbi:hypothetical protein BJ170DRAFT_593432 [Xylariales sp. AK1849]|nr:hypothetical protein BJ170DRAFT_593432 [Xylariales sp. AK1849]
MFLKHPRNTFIVDFECMPSADGPLPLQVAIFDASEQQIVPATVIDHGMTIGELRNKIGLSKFHRARGIFSPVARVQEFYPGRYRDRTTGMTCHAIADLIRKHVDEHGPLKTCITWASHPIAIRCLNYILETAGAEDLLVPEWKFKDQPLGWYSTLLELLEEATSGIASSEVVDDDENSQSNIDELLNEDEKFLRDITGDESVEELSIKLGEENLFKDHLGQNAEFLAIFLRKNQNFLGEDDTGLFVADAHTMNTIEGSTSGDNKGLGETATPATKITNGKRAARTTGATKATKTNNPNADYNLNQKDHNSNNNGESMDE